MFNLPYCIMKTNSQTLLIYCLITISFYSIAQEVSTFTDPRDEQEYKIVDLKIALEAGIFIHRTWMAENLNFKSQGSTCYKNYDAYCEKFGRLYTWDAANTACPEGWHLSTQREWNEVLDTFGGKYVAGKALKLSLIHI